MRAVLIGAAIAAMCGGSCAQRVPEPEGVAPGTPHISWVLMYGDRDTPDREFSCQSTPRSDCVVPPSQPDAPVFTDIHFYYHGAGSETRYEGTKTIGYLTGSREAQTTPTGIVVKKDEAITNESVAGIVTSTPGTYAVAVSLTATVVDTGKTQPVNETIRVIVK